MLLSIALYSGYLILICLMIDHWLIIRHWSKLSAPFRALGYFIAWNLTIEILSRVFQQIEVNNLPLLHIYTLGEFLLISNFFIRLPPIQSLPKPVKLGFLFFVSLLIILNSIFLQPIFGYNSYAKSLGQLIIISYSVSYFYHRSNHFEEQVNQETKSLNLINAAILTYYSGTLFIFMFSDFFFSQGSVLPNGFWVFNSILNLIFQGMVLFAIWNLCKTFKKYMS